VFFFLVSNICFQWVNWCRYDEGKSAEEIKAVLTEKADEVKAIKKVKSEVGLFKLNAVDP
jgi:hypothetical protein